MFCNTKQQGKLISIRRREIQNEVEVWKEKKPTHISLNVLHLGNLIIEMRLNHWQRCPLGLTFRKCMALGYLKLFLLFSTHL